MPEAVVAKSKKSIALVKKNLQVLRKNILIGKNIEAKTRNQEKKVNICKKEYFF